MRERSGRQDVPERKRPEGLARLASGVNATNESGGEAEIAGGVGNALSAALRKMRHEEILAEFRPTLFEIVMIQRLLIRPRSIRWNWTQFRSVLLMRRRELSEPSLTCSWDRRIPVNCIFDRFW